MKREFSSFRDPSGYIFYEKNKIYRAVTYSYKNDYDYLLGSGLYELLIQKKYLLSHSEVTEPLKTKDISIYKILAPEPVDLITYPYEWSFSQLKDAALLTLNIQQIALEFGMSLKDASAYNIQFYKGRPVLIDTLSFEKYTDNKPWVAYGQYCRHFLAPLALMCHNDISLIGLLKNYIDGIPLDLTRKLLPFKVRFNFGLFIHLYLHSRMQIKYQDNKFKVNESKHKLSKPSLVRLITSLQQSTKALKWAPKDTEWIDYQNVGVHTEVYSAQKTEILNRFFSIVNPQSVLDFGANTGYFSRLAAKNGSTVISCDIDPACVENNYLTMKQNKEENIYSLYFDLLNPSPAVGWANKERKTLQDRCKSDLILALALIHHLCISGNIPFQNVAYYFSQIAEWLIIEFVQKSDSKIKILLLNREDIFLNYSKEKFELVFSKYYQIIDFEKAGIENRVIYLMKRKGEF